MLYLNNPTIDALERRLRALPAIGPDTIPTVAEIIAATEAVSGHRKLARARSWAVHALRRIDADVGTIIGMLIAAEAASQGRTVVFSPVIVVPDLDPEPEQLPASAVTHLGVPVTHLGEFVTV